MYDVVISIPNVSFLVSSDVYFLLRLIRMMMHHVMIQLIVFYNYTWDTLAKDVSIIFWMPACFGIGTTKKSSGSDTFESPV